jgi:hypothetical protein
MKKINIGGIGQDKATQDPQDAIEKAEGKYKDPVEAIPQSEKIAYMPDAPNPKPFTLKGRGKK